MFSCRKTTKVKAKTAEVHSLNTDDRVILWLLQHKPLPHVFRSKSELNTEILYAYGIFFFPSFSLFLAVSDVRIIVIYVTIMSTTLRQNVALVDLRPQHSRQRQHRAAEALSNAEFCNPNLNSCSRSFLNVLLFHGAVINSANHEGRAQRCLKWNGISPYLHSASGFSTDGFDHHRNQFSLSLSLSLPPPHLLLLCTLTDFAM